MVNTSQFTRLVKLGLTHQSKLEINTKCRDARKAIEDECYGGGRERGHIQQLTDDANAVVKCQRFYDDKCR